jgi:hypothetical protein
VRINYARNDSQPAHCFTVVIVTDDVHAREMVQQTFATLRLRRDLGEPDGGLGGIHLTEERADAAELVVPPVIEKTGGLRRDLPLTGIGKSPALAGRSS